MRAIKEQTKVREEDWIMKQSVSYFELKGTNREIGKQLARKIGTQNFKIPAPEFFTQKEMDEAIKLYDQYCPGLKEELEGFAEEGNMTIEEIAYTWMSYLVPRCSGIGITGKKSADGHVKLARNYEFGIEEEDLTVCKTQVTGSYAHVGGTNVGFGRNEGINECGLAVAMSSCGIPVSNIPQMNKPKVKGLQFWAVIRSLLENCKDVKEALKLALEMPIAFNINLYLADPTGYIVLLETMDGHKAYKEISETTIDQYVCATNHIVLPELVQYGPMAMKNSIMRYERQKAFLEANDQVEEAAMRKLLTTQCPEGMSANYYKEWFGTIKSVVMDPEERRFSICWFGQESNGWEDYFVADPIVERMEEKDIVIESSEPEFFALEPINK